MRGSSWDKGERYFASLHELLLLAAECFASTVQGFYLLPIFFGEHDYGVSIDTTPPVTTATLSGTLISGSNYQNSVQVTLPARVRPVTRLAVPWIANTHIRLLHNWQRDRKFR
jgi:hypothetical protein